MVLLPIISFLYSSVGHGGASGYLALMALFSFAPEVMKPTALLLNLFVAGIAFYYYYKGGFFNKRLFLYFAIASIPMAFLGGSIEVDTSIYKNILGILLIIAVLKMLNVFGKDKKVIRDIRLWQGLLVGGIIGFFSGLIGIGGGVILTPVILLLHWGKMKEAAAVSALFIWVNSASGLVGQLSIGVSLNYQSFVLVAIAIVGGILGGYIGSKKINNQRLRYILAFVLVLASVKLILV
jgi:Predicted permeases